MNPARPYTKLDFGGTTYRLVADFGAIAEAEDMLERPLITGLSRKDISTPTVNLVRAMLFACARTYHSDLTYEDAKAMVTRKSLPVIWGKVLEAWVSAAAEEEPDSNPPQDQE